MGLPTAGCVRTAAAAAVLCAASAASAQLVFSNNTGITIPALGGAATPYPSEIMVAGLTEPVGLVRVRINGLSHDEINDVDMLLVAPDGTKVLLMSDVGGLLAVVGVDLVFDDAFPPIPVGPLVSGTYRPTDLFDGLGTDDFDAPAPLPPYDTLLSSLTGKAGNGPWQLFVMDDFGGQGGTIAGWELEIFEGHIVTNTADAGPGSLRAAIDGANLNISPSNIIFMIPDIDPGYDALAGVWTIAPTSELPAITAPVSIDGLTQPGAECTGTWPPTLKIVLSGASAGPGAMGLRLASGATGSAVRGLVVNQWSSSGVDLDSATDCKVQSCFIGTDHTGLVGFGNSGPGVVCRNSADSSIIGVDGDGTDDDCERNLISGNSNDGVVIRASNECTVAGNWIGVNITGAAALPNDNRGVCLDQGSADAVIGTNRDGTSDALERNLISGNSGSGVHLNAAGTGVVIIGNTIGLDAAGGSDLGNDNHGVRSEFTDGLLIGDIDVLATLAEQRNVISGNGGRGVLLESCFEPLIMNCFIGTDVTGLVDLGNDASGIRAESCDVVNIGLLGTPGSGSLISGNGARGIRLVTCDTAVVTGCIIGLGIDGLTPLGNDGEGVLAEDSNDVSIISCTISDNGRDGIRIEGALSSPSAIRACRIGTDAAGTLDRGNDQDGVMLTQGASDVSMSPGSVGGNIIAFNAGSGIRISPSAGSGSTFYEGSIHSNGGLGIDIGPEGPEGIDEMDPDSGPNDLINFPTITGIVGTTVSGEYRGVPNADFEIDVYQNDAPDPSGHGEGMVWLGFVSATTDANGVAAWVLTNVVYRTTPLYLAATATDTGATDAGTSEFGPVALTNLCKIDCPPDPVIISAGAGCTGTAAYGVTTAGNCDPTVVLTFDPPEGTVLPFGDTQVTATLRNAAGDVLDECVFTARVVDVTAPAIACPNPINEPNDLDLCGAEVSFTATAIDACDPAPAVACSIPDGMGGSTPITFTHFFPVGTTTVTCTATDNAGNASECMFGVTINDVQGPILDCVTKVEVEADQFGNVVITESLLFPGGVMDNCPDCPVASIEFAPPVIDCALLQEYQIAVTAMDCRGNTSTCIYIVTVTGPDCNNNGVSDGCDIRMGTSLDCNENFIPDECECLWCNGEAPADVSEVTGQASHLGGGVPAGTRIVDDVYFCPGQLHRVTQFTGVMLTNSIPQLRRARLDFYEDCNGVPADDPFLTVGPEKHTIIDTVPAPDGMAMVTYRFDLCDLCLWLEGGKTYWVGLTGLTDHVNQNDVSFWVIDQRPEAGIVGKAPYKAEGTTIPPWNGEFTFGEWMPADECCLGCHNMVFCLFGDSCKVLWDNGPAATDAAAGGSPSGAHQSYESRSADDLMTQTCEDHDVCVIDAWVWTDCEPVHGFIEVYENEPCNSPNPAASAWRTFDVDKAIETGVTTIIDGRSYRLVCLRIVDPGLTLLRGRTYWISAGVRSTGSFITNSFFAWGSRDCRDCDYSVAPAHTRAIRPTLTEWEPIVPSKSLAFRVAVREAALVSSASEPLPGEEGPTCTADANFDGQISVEDIFFFLGAWFAGCP